MNQCPSRYEGCCVIRKKQASQKRIETRALNICWSRPSPEYAEDSEEDKAPVWTRESEYELGDQLFMTRILPDSTVEDLHAISTTSQKLAEGACRSAEAWKEPLVLPDCVREFKSIFAKEDFDVLPEHRQWDHAIELIPGLESKSSKVYSLSPVEQKELDSFLEKNLCTGRICPSKSSMAALVFFIKKKDGSLQLI